MNTVQPRPYKFDLAPSLNDVPQKTCTFCNSSNWNITALNTSFRGDTDLSRTACIFIAPNGSILVVHLLELLLATSFELTLNDREITKTFKLKSTLKEHELISHLISINGFVYDISLGIETLMKRANMTSINSLFNHFKGFDAQVVFPLIQKTALDPHIESKYSPPNADLLEAEDVTIKQMYEFYIFSQNSIVFTTVIHLTNGISRAIETEFLYKHLVNFSKGSFQAGSYKIVSGHLSQPTPPESTSFKDVKVSDAKTDIALDSEKLSLIRVVALNNGKSFQTTSRHPTATILKDFSQYRDKARASSLRSDKT